ncbi:MAG: hypothetical protein WC812_03100 [Candidatus Pacearchaeota archaeon]|jgi:hypothetical protein
MELEENPNKEIHIAYSKGLLEEVIDEYELIVKTPKSFFVKYPFLKLNDLTRDLSDLKSNYKVLLRALKKSGEDISKYPKKLNYLEVLN